MIPNLIFHEYGIIDVTRFDATPENPELGYLCGGIVSLFSNGRIQILDANEGGEELESLHVYDLVCMNTNINSFNPEHLSEIALMMKEKSIRITFNDAETKYQFAETLEKLRN